MKMSLGLRLFLACLGVILAGGIVLAVVTQFVLPQAYGRHLGMMENVSLPNGGIGAGPGRGQATAEGAAGMFTSFRSSFNEALVWASLAALTVAVIVSIIVSRSLVAPIHAMTHASQRISQGHYEERVRIKGGGELERLAGSFNSMAEKLEDTENMRRQLIGDVSHELRTPLTAIRGSMEGLIDGVLPANRETYVTVHQAAGRLARLVDDLQELSRVESGAFELELRPIAVRTVVDFTMRSLSAQYQGKDVTLTADLPDSLPKILADEDRLGQILINLVGNALHYTPRGGNVKIFAAERGKAVSISVQDSGIGIPADHLHMIFDRFYRVDKSRSRTAGGGSGIGLTIAKRLVEAHGGEIQAESPGIGQGATFTFTIPQA